MALRTDYKDDILDLTQNTQRKYRMITNADGTVSFEDVTVYSQVGDSFGASELNEIANAVKSASGGIQYIHGDVDEIQIQDDDGNWHFYDYGGLNKIYLYKDGVTNTNLVSEFVAGASHSLNWDLVAPTFNEDNIVLSTPSNNKVSVTISGNLIDFTPYTINSYTKLGCKILEGDIEKEFELDITDVNGSYYVGAYNLYKDYKITTAFGITSADNFNSGKIIATHRFNDEVTPTDNNKVIKVIEFWFRK